MKKKIHYEENPFGEVKLGKRVFVTGLPSLEEIANAEQTAKITLSLTARSLKFFKNKAEKYNIPYQVMIRRLLDEYSARES